jgi:hypothetical protein
MALHCAHLFLLKQTPSLTHILLDHKTFPKHFDKLTMDFATAKVFRVQKLNYRTHLKSARLVIGMVPYKALTQ